MIGSPRDQATLRIALDHVGYCGPDLGRMIRDFQRLGFRVSEPAALDAGRAESSTATQRSAHMLFAQNYIELTSVEPCPPEHHLAAYQGDQPALRLLLLATGDAGESHRKLRSQGIEAGPTQAASRQLTYGNHGLVRFHWFGLQPGTLPATLTGFVQHLDREQVFDSGQMQHPNSAAGISALYFRLPHRAWHWPAGLLDGAGEVELREVSVPSGQSSAELPAHGPTQRAPLLCGVEMRVRDLQRLEQCLAEGAVPYRRTSQTIRVSAEMACGAEMSFREAA